MRKTNSAITLDPTRRSNDAAEFENALRRKIVGQDQAIEKIAEIFQMFVAGLNPTIGIRSDAGTARVPTPAETNLVLSDQC